MAINMLWTMKKRLYNLICCWLVATTRPHSGTQPPRPVMSSDIQKFNKISTFYSTRVAWTQVGPSVNTFFIFHILRIWNFLKFGNVNTMRVQRISPSQPNLFQFVWISSNKTHSKINIFHTLVLKIVKWTLLNLTCWGLSNNIMNTPKFQ
jgi:hypothetical protein